MATSGSILCGVCDGKQVTRCADVFCTVCQEGLCSECQQHHSLSRATKWHEVISIDNYQKLPDFMKYLSENCSEHEMKFSNYCPQHDQVCCPRCLTSIHHECTNIKAVADLTQNAKKSSLVFICEQNLNDLSVFLNRAIDDRKYNLSSFRNQKSNFREEIKSIRSQINNHLDKLEHDILEELDNAEVQTKTQIESITKQLAENAKKVKDYADGMTAILEYGSDLHAFLGTRLIQDEIRRQEKYLRSISEDGNLKTFRLDVSFEGKIQDLLTEIIKFGSVSVEIEPPSLVYSGEKNIQKQITSATQHIFSRSINDMKLTLLSTIDIPESTKNNKLEGCVIGPNNKINMFTDYENNRIIIVNQNNKVEKEIAIKFPGDVTVIDDNTVAVTTLGNIKIIDIISGQTKQEFNTENCTCGVTYYKGSLLWCEKLKGIQSKQLPDGDICTLVQQEDLPGCSYITANNDKIYQTNYKTKTVTCFTSRGEKNWDFKDEVLLPDPSGVAVDNDCNVYVTSANSNTVVVISSNGKHGRQLLGETDAIENPYGIYYDKSKNYLLIANSNGPAFLYQLF